MAMVRLRRILAVDIGLKRLHQSLDRLLTHLNVAPMEQVLDVARRQRSLLAEHTGKRMVPGNATK